MTSVGASSLYGNLNLLVLRSLAEGPLHGLAVARRIRRLSDDVLRVEEGALYPALHRLERDGFLRSDWGVSEQNRRARYYELTPEGRLLLEREIESWTRHAEAVTKVLSLDEV